MTSSDPSPPPGSAFKEHNDLFSYAAVAAVVASVTGVTALVIDLVAVVLNGAEPSLGPIYTPALLIGLIFGRASARTRAGRIAMHLSWAPFVVTLIVLAASGHKEESAAFLREFGGTLLEMITTAGDVVEGAVKG